MQKIVPHLWFAKQAKEAAEFYVKAFGGDSAVTEVTTISDTPSGEVDIVQFKLLGYEFMAISAGPFFKINPSVSFIVNFDPTRRPEAKAELERLWVRLVAGGKALMPLDRYPFSDCYGGVQDKYGVSWQLILSNPEGGERPAFIPALMFTQKACGQADEAMKFYTSVFRDTREGISVRYGSGQAPDQEGTVMFADFMLQGQWFAALDSAQDHNFIFNEGVSLVVHCDNQEEIDYFWQQLSAVPQAEQCGWLKDKFGVSWQIVPARMAELMGGTDQQRARVTQAFLKMKKFDIATLEAAYAGKG
jgi:predicted 3-demethylubiquinone-9 3-methyltransferase (glyoxalase superfamily)